ncbi:MAG: hypothetical protein HZA35_03800 [Parcubacteria group bacterium]|nr:hypothetical protein [Parcubacteria group bacterium]
MKLITYFFISLGLIVGLIVPHAHAFTITHIPLSAGNDFIVSPVHFDFDLTEHRMGTSTLTIVNHSNETVDFKVAPEGRGNGVADAHDWITVEVPVFTLRPNEKISSSLVIQAPGGIGDGVYYANVVISENTRNGGGVMVVSRVSTEVFVTIDTQHALHPSGLLKKFEVPLVQEGSDVAFGIQYKNSGNVYMKQSGNISVKSVFGGKSVEVPVAPFYILPGEEKKIGIPYSIRQWGVYSVSLDLQGEHQKTNYLFVLPLRAIFLAIVLAFLVIRFRTLWIT